MTGELRELERAQRRCILAETPPVHLAAGITDTRRGTPYRRGDRTSTEQKQLSDQRSFVITVFNVISARPQIRGMRGVPANIR
jgi:hypothetical protein